MSDEGHRWLSIWLPVAQAGGPFLTLGLAVVMVISLTWMNSWLNECIDRNRLMAAQLVTQQEKFYTDIMVRLAPCPPRP